MGDLYQRHFQPAVKKALPAAQHGLRFHDLGHTTASLLIADGANPKAVQARLGHAASLRITLDRDSHLYRPRTWPSPTDSTQRTPLRAHCPRRIATMGRSSGGTP
jgi:integrase